MGRPGPHLPPFLGPILDGLRGAEQRLLRPLARRFRGARSARARRRAMEPASEELLVALLRARLRQADHAGASLPTAGDDVGALVRGLLDVPPPPAGTPAVTAAPPESLERAA